MVTQKPIGNNLLDCFWGKRGLGREHKRYRIMTAHHLKALSGYLPTIGEGTKFGRKIG